MGPRPGPMGRPDGPVGHLSGPVGPGCCPVGQTVDPRGGAVAPWGSPFAPWGRQQAPRVQRSSEQGPPEFAPLPPFRPGVILSRSGMPKPRDRQVELRDGVQPLDLDRLRAFLGRQERDFLAGLLFEQAVNDERLLQRLALEMAREDGGTGPDLAALRRRLEDAFQPDDRILSSWREVAGFARRLGDAVGVLWNLLQSGHARATLDLVEHALALGEKALFEVDDSHGHVSMVLRDLRDLHLAACEQVRPDPEELARRLFDWEVRGELSTFSGAVESYAEVLGLQGLAIYRELAEAAEREGSEDRFRIERVFEGLARVAGDLEAVVALKARNLSSAWRFLEIAQLYKQAGQDGRALEWAENGVRAFPQGTDSRLRLFLAQEYEARQRYNEALALLWADFTESPSLDCYRSLVSLAGRIGRGRECREAALSLLRQRALEEAAPRGTSRLFVGSPSSELVRILLGDGDVEGAWRAGRELGCSEDLWLELARRREGTHPEESLGIYREAVESAVLQGNDYGYRRAVELLGRIRHVMRRLDRADELASYLAAVRLTHKRKRSFVRLLDAARLELSEG
jgi:tetratricopeptide (TPR) repeat protein